METSPFQSCTQTMITITKKPNGPQQFSRDARRRRTRSRSLSFRSSDLKLSQLDRNLMKYEIGVVCFNYCNIRISVIVMFYKCSMFFLQNRITCSNSTMYLYNLCITCINYIQLIISISSILIFISSPSCCKEPSNYNRTKQLFAQASGHRAGQEESTGGESSVGFVHSLAVFISEQKESRRDCT